MFHVDIMSDEAVYLSLQHRLEILVQQVSDGDIASDMGPQLMQFWQQELALMEGDSLSPDIYNQWRSLHTEVHRELRLLNMDLMFLGSSRSASIQSVRQKAAGDRLEKLLRYCEQIQSIIALDDPHKPA